MDISGFNKEIAEQLKKEFPEAAIGITGCRSSGEPYPPCEYNYIIVQEGTKRIERRLTKNNFIELLFLDKDTVHNTSENMVILALLDMNVISDPSWDLIPIVYKIKTESSRYLQQYAKRTLFKSLTDLGRFKDAIDEDNTLDAGFWLLNASNSFAKSIIALSSKIPRDSHLLNEFRTVVAVSPDMFKIWFEASGANLATKVAVIRRLDALRELFRVGSIFSDSTIFNDPKYAYIFIEATSNYLVKSHAIVDAYCYLGLEITRVIDELYELKCRIKGNPPLFQEMFRHLTNNEKPLRNLSMQTIRLIGINSEEKILKEQSSNIKSLIQKVAKNISKE